MTGPAVSNPPKLWVLAGPNGAGKTSLFNEMLRGEIPFINADEIAVENSAPGQGLDVVEAGRIAVERRNQALARGDNFSIETTLSGTSAIRFMKRAKALGYKIDFAYVGLDSAEMSSDRVSLRVSEGGHDVPEEAIIRRYPDSLSKLEQAMRLADRAYIFDNSGRERQLLLIVEDQKAIWIELQLPNWVEEAVPEDLRRFRRPGGTGREKPGIEI